MILAVMLSRHLKTHLSGWNSTVSASGACIALVVVAFAAMPALNEIPDDFPAVVLWKFRIASLGTQLAMWTTLALAFGAWAEAFLLSPVARARRAVG